MTGIRSSWQPIASISSRITCMVRVSVRYPSGMNDHSPEPTWRT